MMRTVIVSLIPLMAVATYFYGLRVLLLFLVVNAVGIGIEYMYEKRSKKKISEAIFITCILYTMTLPPSTPFWIAAVGIVFGVFFGKMVFGGFGKNIFNPALVGRAFIYVSFPEPMTIHWTKASEGFPGGLGTYLNDGIEMISQATPMQAYRDSGAMEPIFNLFIGNISGSIGETSAVLIILAGA